MSERQCVSLDWGSRIGENRLIRWWWRCSCGAHGETMDPDNTTGEIQPPLGSD